MQVEKENARATLKILTRKKHVWFTKRGNRSIVIAMRTLKELEKNNVLFQGEGGWMTYESSIEEAGLTPIKLTTDNGIIIDSELQFHDHDSALLINSLAGYAAMHDMEHIFGLCVAHNQLLVNDVAGSIGSEQAKIGDIIIGSFGKAKPVNLHTGGFIATDDEDIAKAIENEVDEEPDMDYIRLTDKLKGLDATRKFLLAKAKQVKEDLKDHQIIHPEYEGFNVIIKYENEEEKQKIIEYCNEKNLEFTQCPREIRIQDEAISIEIKRLVDTKDIS